MRLVQAAGMWGTLSPVTRRSIQYFVVTTFEAEASSSDCHSVLLECRLVVEDVAICARVVVADIATREGGIKDEKGGVADVVSDLVH